MNDNKRESKGRHILKSLFSVFSFLMLRMKNENRHIRSYSYKHFFVFELGIRKLDYPVPAFYHGITERKPKGRNIQQLHVFVFFLFYLAKEKNENRYNGAFYFSFFVWGLGKTKKMNSYSYSIFHCAIEKLEKKGRNIHGPCLSFQYLHMKNLTHTAIR